MASLYVPFFLCVILHVILLLSTTTVDCKNDDEQKLLQGINNFRTTLNISILKENDNAGCLADEIAEKLEDQPCTNTNTGSVSTGYKFANYPDALKKCKIDINTTNDAVLLPACVPHLVSTQVLSNFTQSHYSRYLNDSKFTGIGIGSEDDWIVVVLSSNTPVGTLANAGLSKLVSKVYLVDQCLILILVLYIVMVIV